jgi:PAS domain S-box-containing protein
MKVADIWGEETFNTIIKPYIDKCLAGNEVHYQKWFEFKDEEPRFYDVSYYPYYGSQEDVTHAVVVTHDITERERAEEELRRKAEEFAALYETSLGIITQHELPTLLETIVERALRLLNGTSGGMYMCDPDRKEVRCVVSYKTPRDYTGTVLKYGEGAAGTVAQIKEPLIIDDYRTWSTRATVFEKEQPFSAVISVPMIWHDEVVGVIHVLHDVETRRFTQADLKLLTLFANQAVIAIQNARLVEQVQSHAAELQRRLVEVEERTHQLKKATEELQREIGERKQAEKSLQQSEEKYRTLIEESFDGIFVQKGPTIIFTNQRLNEMLGYEEGELVGLDHWLVYHPDYQETTRKRAQARMRGEKVTHQYEVNISLEEEHGIQVWVRDITERKRSEEELKTRQTYLESVLHGAPDAIVTLDASHHVLEWNIGAEQIFGYTPNEAIGKNLDDLVTGPDVIDESKELTTQVLSGGKVLPRETVRYRKDGNPVNVIVAGSPIIIRDELQGVVAVYTDITSRKQTEDALKESEEKYRTILESIEDGYYEVDLAGKFTFFNDSICKILGYTNDELMGMDNRQYTEKENAERLYQTFNRVYKTGKPTN